MSRFSFPAVRTPAFLLEAPLPVRFLVQGLVVGAISALSSWILQVVAATGTARDALLAWTTVRWFLAAPPLVALLGMALGWIGSGMGGTLFEYVFRDLLKIFGLTTGALTGIMSFGGLLRPLTQQGLDAYQVGQILAYFSPTMTAYSLPIAALFAATVVYGRLSADNELTACRAGGIGLGPFFGMAFPALLFGLLVAITSLMFLCFVVPTYTLKVERVIYSNLAKLIQNRIDRTHEIRFAGANVFAQRAFVPPADPADPNKQVVVLEGVVIYQYESPNKVTARPDAAAAAAGGAAAAPADPNKVFAPAEKGVFSRVPKEFQLASTVTIEIREREDDQVTLVMVPENASQFPRVQTGGQQMFVERLESPVFEMPSPIKEDTKFMDVWKLQELYNRPELSRTIARYTGQLARRDQSRQYLERLRAKLNGPERLAWLGDEGADFRVKIVRAPFAPEAVIELGEDGELVVVGTHPATISYESYTRSGGGDAALVRPTIQSARELRVRARPDNEHKLMSLSVELNYRMALTPADEPDEPAARPAATAAAPSTTQPGGRPVSKAFKTAIDERMPDDIRALVGRPIKAYEKVAKDARQDRERKKAEADRLDAELKAAATTTPAAEDEKLARQLKRERLERLRAETGRRTQQERDWEVLRREDVVLKNNILAESNGRASFAVSCLILVLVGTALGMMFKSGNFLTAFAISFVPAL
ncbi:MAG TPA: LptF/LptG family permease, partial [Humisphaera sp.]